MGNGKRKKGLWKAGIATLLSSVLLLSAPMAYLPVDLLVYAAEEQADENGFLIVDGVLKKYSGTATEVVIPDNVTSIGDSAFSGCRGLKSISIPEGVTSIGDRVFGGCSELTSIVVEEGNKVYDSRENCNAIIESSNNMLIAGCNKTVIPDSVTSIGSCAFENCSGLTSILIPDSVTSIGDYAFRGCSELTSIVVEEGNKVYDSRENCNAIIESSSNILIVGCNKTVIPEGVTSIGSNAFDSCWGLTSISIPNSVTSIGYGAFENCSGLTSISIPNSVTSIGRSAFRDCRGLTSISVPEGVTSIEWGAFEDCRGLTSILIPEGVTSIGDYAFNGCSGLMSISIPNSVTSIGVWAFRGCSGLTSISISEGVTSIGGGAFIGCSGLTSISIPNSVTNIGSSMFSYCNGLTSIVVEEGNTTYDSRENCNAIIESSSNTLIAGCNNTVIPNSVTNIGDSAFSGCSGLKNINIPEGVTSIGNDAFDSCWGLTSIRIPSSVMSIGTWIPMGMVFLTICGEEGSYAETYAKKIGIPFYAADENGFSIENGILVKYFEYFGTNKKDVVIPEGVTSIGDGAFEGCSSLTSINIPEGVTSIGDGAFEGCSSLTSINIPEGVTSIGILAFENCGSLISVNIPEGVTSIGDGAFEGLRFYGCSELTSINIPNSVTSIANSAFEGCSGLTSINIPNSVTSIGMGAFYGCNSLTSIVVEEGNPTYDSRENCNAIIESSSNTLIVGGNETVIPDSVTSIGNYAFYGCSGLTSISIPESVTSIWGSAFEGCSGLTSISISNSVTSIGWAAFDFCSSLTSIVVEEGNTVYDSRENCNAIIESSSNRLIVGGNETVIPDSVTSIGEFAFSERSGLKSINIPNSVTSIERGAFYGCSGLTSVNIPNSITSIGGSAFEGCSGLTSIIIPNSVTSIGSGAFYGCDKLTIYGKKGSFVQTYAKRNNIPFLLLDGQEDDPEISENILTLEEISQLTEENKTQDTIIETTDGLTFTFKKGTMELVDGVDSYDFGAKITEDYAFLPNQVFAEEEFAFQINYNYEGQLPGEAQITIPAGSKWAGQRLYYYEILEDGTYSYVCRSTVKADGSYTVKQSRGGTYVATTKVPENLGDCDGDKEITSKDALAILKYNVEISQEYFIVELADCDGEDGITSRDALAVLKYAVGIVRELK